MTRTEPSSRLRAQRLGIGGSYERVVVPAANVTGACGRRATAPTAGAAVTFTWRHLATLLLALAVALAMGWLPGGSGSSVGPAGGGSPTVRAARGASFLARRELSGAVVLTNSVQGLRATVNDGRLAVTGAHGLRLGLSAPAIGRGGELAPVARLGAVVLQGSSVALAAPAVSEWFTNGPHGMEQGFTIRERPAGSGPLKISQVVSGNAVGNLDAGGATRLVRPLDSP